MGKREEVDIGKYTQEKNQQGANNGKWSEHHCELSICLSEPECGSTVKDNFAEFWAEFGFLLMSLHIPAENFPIL